MRSWPDAIHEAVRERVGVELEVSPLGGMGGGSVVRVTGCGRSAILKRGTSPVETHVYTVMAERLRAGGVDLPELYAECRAGDTFWLLLEDVPQPLPRERWQADRGQLEMLGNLHAIPLDEVRLPPAGYRPDWTPNLTEDALSLLDAAERKTVAGMLRRIRDETHSLFEPEALLSGDPNPVNWGLRANGSLVLYDWERCTCGARAIDLAITVPGLGERTIYRRVAEGYLPGGSATDVGRLATAIGRAKVWSAVEFLAHYARGELQPTLELQPLVAQFPEWLGSLVGGVD